MDRARLMYHFRYMYMCLFLFYLILANPERALSHKERGYSSALSVFRIIYDRYIYIYIYIYIYTHTHEIAHVCINKMLIKIDE